MKRLMKFFQLFRKELKLLLNNVSKFEIILKYKIKIQLAVLLLISIIMIPSCDNKNEEQQKPSFSFGDSAKVKSETKKLLGENLKISFTGNFDEDSLQEAAALIELTENNIWGIKFVLLKAENGKLVKKYESDLLEGSFKESVVKKIRFPEINHDLLYYNSQDYFWGSGGGEVFAYIVDFAAKETYYAHLFSESRSPVELFLSKNITAPELKNFFVSSFKKDYPNFRLVSEDVSLEF